MSEECFHCKQEIVDLRISFDHKVFCCNGCKTVYEILNQNNLEDYYNLNSKAGIKPESGNFDFLDTPQIFDKVVDFSEEGITLVSFKIPTIHCSACIWLLESIKDFNKNIKYSTVDFSHKSVQIAYKSDEYKLSELAVFLTHLGYKPVINLETAEKKPEKVDRSLIIKLAIAGFAFGNTMLLAIPEFLNETDIWLEKYSSFFRLIMFILSLPVFLYSSSVYYKSAWGAVKNGRLNIDVPIVIGIFNLFFRSCYEAYFDISNGYFDTLCGLLFFMLLGRYFQERTYKTLAFDRDYKSFYPIAITRLSNAIEESVLVSKLKVGDRLIIRNQEIIPADSILIKGEAFIDNSFITGESNLISKKEGDKIFAGGKQSGSLIELEMIKEVNQSYLTKLWNNEAFKKDQSRIDTLVNIISKYFVIFILTITILSGLYWYFVKNDVTQMFQVITAILIIACPCALALSTPFTMGNMMRILGHKKFYVKDSTTIEKLSKVTHIVFDKTGTLTLNKEAKIVYEGKELSEDDFILIRSVIKNSNHPLSRMLYNHIQTESLQVSNFQEILGKGVKGIVRDKEVIIGSSSLVNYKEDYKLETKTYLKIDGEVKGKFIFKNKYRTNLNGIIKKIDNYKISVLSGDNKAEKDKLMEIFPKETNMLFDQTPEDKLNYIRGLQDKKDIVMMLGDGLNDAGALKQSDVGIAISDDINSFTPSSDVILDGRNFSLLPAFLGISKKTVKIILISFVISLLYNVIGLSFAVTGNLSPLIAAILMPISSISVVIFTTIATRLVATISFK